MTYFNVLENLRGQVQEYVTKNRGFY